MKPTMNIHRCRFVDYTPHTISAVAFSHPSNTSMLATSDLRMAVGRNNGDIEIWNPKFNWTHELTLSGSKGRSIEGLCWAVSEDDKTPRLFSIGGSTYITEWDLSTGLPRTNYDCNVGIIWSIAVNKTGTKIAIGSDDGSVCIVDISGGFGSLEHEMVCQRQDSRVLSIKWYEDDMIVGGCADARIRCWSSSRDTKGRILGTMRVDKSKTESTLVWSIEVLSNRRQIISGDSTGSVKVWDLNNFTLLQSFNNHEADVLCITHDTAEEKFFTAGVDRKIHQFNLISTSGKSNTSKWVHSYNRLLHSNDVRSMAVFESKGYNFLVSGGVEKSIVIQSTDQFHDGKYRKLALTQQQKNVLVNEAEKLVIMWQEQTIKVWRTEKLVAKLTLSDEENVTSVSINEDGNLLCVATMDSVKVFELISVGNKLKVSKIKAPVVTGAKKVLIYNINKLIILSSSEELYQFDINTEDQTIELVDEIELEAQQIKSNVPYINNINNMVIKANTLIISRFNGFIEVVNLNDFSAYKLTQVTPVPHLIEIGSNNTLVVVTEDNKIHEFDIRKDDKLDSLVTSWSKRNSEFLPKQFLTLDDKPEGMFIDGSKVWIHGKSWLCFFNMSMNVPIDKYYKNTATSKKRNRDGLTIDEDEDEEDETDMLLMSLKQSQIDKIKQDKDTNENEKPFWITSKYRPILCVDKFGDDLVVVERPQASLDPAFKVAKLRV